MRPGTRMGVIPMGSADGGARLHAGEVLVRGRRAKFLSGASLEHMRVDLTEIPEAQLGDEVVFVGEQGREAITAEAVVEHQNLQRITDIAMAVGPRIPRRYLEAE
ncbi:MAG TPA: alanine racemase C-terminal domain-containing protein [Stellaceae bacterium]|nr:alanine racemase C-terminal domain-containing protein [Stellaceae bacterium]